MGDNYFTGNVPDWLSDLPKVRAVTFSRNQFYGLAPNLTKYIVNGNFTSAITRWLFECNYLEGDWPPFYLPKTSIEKYYSNCWNNETDGCATTGCPRNVTQDTPSNCSRIYNCPSFFAAMQASQFKDRVPCPPSQFIIDEIRCICGRDHVSNEESKKISVGAVVGGVVGGVVNF